jgi:ABC-type transport system substrate-binding protein
MKKRLSLLMAALLLLGALAACNKDAGGDNAGSDKIYRTGMNYDWESCDPQMTTADYTVPLNIFDRLVEIAVVGDGVSEIVPGLATEWSVSPDGLVYNFKLREDVKFHNGEVFKADDVKYTFERALLPETAARNTDAFTPILGAMDMLENGATELKGFEIVSDNEINITLEDAYAPFLANLATPAGSIFNRKACTEAGKQHGIDPFPVTVGTGPYKLEEWVLNDHSLITAFDDYWNGRPKHGGVRFQTIMDSDTYRMMFESDELDELDFDNARTLIPYFTDNAQWKDNIVSGNRVGVYYYSMNQNIEPFGDVRVRKAFQRAIDRQSILDGPLYAGAGFVHSGILAKGLIGYNPDLPVIPYDPEEAMNLITEAGYPDGFDMQITQTTESPNTLALNELVQAMLKEVKINASIEQMDEATWYAVRGEGELGAYNTSWSADFNDPDNFLYTFFTPLNTVSRSFNYKNTDAMARVEAARYMTDADARVKEYQELEKLIIQEDATWAPLFQLEHLWVLQDRVSGMTPLWNGWSGYFYSSIELAD